MICNPLNFIASAVRNQFQYLMASCNLSQGECWFDFYFSFTQSFIAKLHPFKIISMTFFDKVAFSSLTKRKYFCVCNIIEVFLSDDHFY